MKSSSKRLVAIIMLFVFVGIIAQSVNVYLSKPTYLNLRVNEIETKAPVGIHINDLRRILGPPISEKIGDNGLLILTYANSPRRRDGNDEYPISVLFFVKNEIVTARYYYVH